MRDLVLPKTHQSEASDALASGASRRVSTAIVAAAALVVHADGGVHPAERGELLAVLRDSPAAAQRSSADVPGTFDAHLDRLSRCPQEEAVLLDLLRPLAGQPPAWTILRIAERIAASDRALSPAELTMIARIREALSLPPGVPERFPACVIWGYEALMPAPGDREYFGGSPTRA